MRTKQPTLASTTNKVERAEQPELCVSHCVEQITQPLNVGNELEFQPYGKENTERLRKFWEKNECVYISTSNEIEPNDKSFSQKLRVFTKKLSERLRATTKTERLVFACCVYYGVWELILKIM